MAGNLGESTATSSELTAGKQVRNLLIVIVAIALSVALFLGIKSQNTDVSLAALDETSTPLEVALSNGKPTLMEFYANWCTVCQAMASDIAQLEQEYTDVNYVMLNVDNTKWLPEMLKYRVDGIPHFVFLDRQGEAIASVVGSQPRTIMATNLEAMVADQPLPYAQTSGQVSKFTAPVAPAAKDDPRNHGSQVVN
ncbi:MAG TPA: thioredoxin family protein [Leptolyngbyaceae cyanobacterium]